MTFLLKQITDNPEAAITIVVCIACVILLLIQYHDIRKHPEMWR